MRGTETVAAVVEQCIFDRIEHVAQRRALDGYAS
jgi:hypothetical protein